MRLSFAVTILATGLLCAAAAHAAERQFDTDILRQTFGFTDRTPHTVPLSEFHQGCPARDCIHSIDHPKLIAAADATFLHDDDAILGLIVGNEARAYPVRILNFHEIVNDTVGGRPVAVTFCPLCGSGIAVKRVVDGKPVEFGVAGVLYNSDLVMYDRASSSLWSQIESAAVVGPRTGTRLTRLPLTVATWADWRKAHLDTKVLSTDTGFDENYGGEDHYAQYVKSDRIAFPVSARDARRHPKLVVYGLEMNGRPVAYARNWLADRKPHADTFNGRRYEVRMGGDGSVSARDLQSGETHAAVRLFWFAWYTFHPDTELREAEPPRRGN